MITNRITFWDVAVIACLVSLGCYLLETGSQSGSTAKIVQIVSSKGWERTYPLGNHQIVEVEGRIGESVIEISREGVRFVDSCCPNHLCMKRGWVSKPGDMVACVPNGIIVRVIGKPEYDVITP